MSAAMCGDEMAYAIAPRERAKMRNDNGEGIVLVTLQLNFEWEEATVSTTLSDDATVRQSAAQFKYPPRNMLPRQAAFYRNLIRMAELTRSRNLPLYVVTIAGDNKRLDFGCVKLAEHAGFIETISDAQSGFVESICLAWRPSNAEQEME